MGAMGDAERTKNRQTDMQKAGGSGVLGAQREMHNSLVTFLILFALLLFSIFSFKAFLLYNFFFQIQIFF
jgi:hypothetical protein